MRVHGVCMECLWLCAWSAFVCVFDLVLWELKHGKRSVRGQAGTFVDLLEADTRVPKDCLLAAMDDSVGWRKRAMGVGGGGGGVDWGRPSSSSNSSSSSSSVSLSVICTWGKQSSLEFLQPWVTEMERWKQRKIRGSECESVGVVGWWSWWLSSYHFFCLCASFCLFLSLSLSLSLSVSVSLLHLALSGIHILITPYHTLFLFSRCKTTAADRCKRCQQSSQTNVPNPPVNPEAVSVLLALLAVSQPL